MTSTKSIKELITFNIMENSITEKQISILCAAIELFSVKGYESTATSEIAKKANVAEGTIFRHYKTKKDLLLAIPDILSKISSFEIFLDDISKTLNYELEPFEVFLKKLVINRKKFVSEISPILKVIAQEVPFQPELRSKIFDVVIHPSIKKLKIIIDKFKMNGQLINIPSDFIINLIISCIFGYLFLNNIALPQLKSSEYDLEYLIQCILYGICQNKCIDGIS